MRSAQGFQVRPLDSYGEAVDLCHRCLSSRDLWRAFHCVSVLYLTSSPEWIICLDEKSVWQYDPCFLNVSHLLVIIFRNHFSRYAVKVIRPHMQFIMSTRLFVTLPLFIVRVHVSPPRGRASAADLLVQKWPSSTRSVSAGEGGVGVGGVAAVFIEKTYV